MMKKFLAVILLSLSSNAFAHENPRPCFVIFGSKAVNVHAVKKIEVHGENIYIYVQAGDSVSLTLRRGQKPEEAVNGAVQALERCKPK